ncbi:MAG TPA: alpha-1,4-glucan--maltose-1-phosphate maltosyltransferase, partial [Gemmatimonadaceae bacterium]|nr:alpha-1,4-glucan--maltose-1-phosphate maltosyltransferase [Gemmatimonadaceae bacterium]
MTAPTKPTTSARKTAPRSNSRRPVPHIAIECVEPQLDGGRFAVKRVMGDSFEVSADIFKDGHDLIKAQVRYRSSEDAEWRFVPLVYDFDSDRWSSGFPLDRIGLWRYTVDAWTDRFGSWRRDLQKKLDAGQDVAPELLEGAAMVDTAARRARFGEARTTLKRWSTLLKGTSRDMGERTRAALDLTLLALMEEHFPREGLTSYSKELEVWVDRERARFAAWYEMFPRSQTTVEGGHGTFTDAERALPRIADMGFDVIYLPPIHPVGVTKRKGPNNTPDAGADAVGSPWAIGSEYGGHAAVDPRLGTVEDFEHFVDAAHRLDMEIALDYALQCSPDHPWLKEHPDWFFVRPDGSIKYAENPPKKYEDIYPIDFWCADRENLWNACLDILLFWVERGVNTFRVDNPHTKPFAFWEWVIAEVRSRHPQVIFLAEAFTRPKKMKYLAKLGFSESYTYFTWRNTSYELREYLTELTQTPMREYFRGNFFANTPDILHEYLQTGDRPAFRVRLILAATLSPLYGIYSGFELCENIPLREGSEEYLHSEKYEIRVRDWDAPGNLNDEITAINRIRRDNRALQLYSNLSFHRSENDQTLFYLKTAEDFGGRNDVMVVVNLDPHRIHETLVHVPLDILRLDPSSPYVVEDLLTGARFTWRGEANYVRLDPAVQVAHVL